MVLSFVFIKIFKLKPFRCFFYSACPVTSPLNDEKLAWVVNLMDSVLEEEQISSAAAWSLTSSGVSLIASAGEENRQQPVVDVISSETKNKEKNNNQLAALDVGNEEVAFHAVEEPVVAYSAVDQVSEDNSNSMTKHSFPFY